MTSWWTLSKAKPLIKKYLVSSILLQQPRQDFCKGIHLVILPKPGVMACTPNPANGKVEVEGMLGHRTPRPI